MSWIDLVFIIYELVFFSAKVEKKEETQKTPEKQPVKKVIVKKRPHINRIEFYDRMNHLLLMSSHAYDLATNERVKDSCLNIIEMCHHIKRAENIEEQSHILFNEYYYEKIHKIYEGTIDLHRHLCKIKIEKDLKNSLMRDSF